MRHPIVTEVLQLYRVARTDEGVTPALALAINPPAYLWHALQFYVRCLDRVRAEEMKRQREERERERKKRTARHG
jgi:hypothetical protein